VHPRVDAGWRAIILLVAKRAGIYIHIPFCERKCSYCDFNTTGFSASLASRYISAVAREIAYWGDRVAGGDHVAIDTIYFGGGTPSIIEAEQVAVLIEACRAAFAIAEDAEITIEINPAKLPREKLGGWRNAGVNRASVGVQSFIDHELAAMGRTHTAEEACLTFEALREAGFDNINLDLIAALPRQTMQDWEFNLQQALRMRPEHLSLYLLEVKEGTQLFGQIKRGLIPCPDDDLAAEMYEMTCEMMREAGYEHYEVSNFARLADRMQSKSAFRSRHNMKYWTGAPFYGIGCSAHSYDVRARWVNIAKTERYIASVAVAGCAIAHRRELSDVDRAAEALFMGLRLTEGIDLAEFRADYGVDVIGRYGNELARLGESGLIELDGNRMRLTRRGLLMSNEVFMVFI
jgi:oxygen-independent coproporphyrinogen-3 oxidase